MFVEEDKFCSGYHAMYANGNILKQVRYIEISQVQRNWTRQKPETAKYVFH